MAPMATPDFASGMPSPPSEDNFTALKRGWISDEPLPTPTAPSDPVLKAHITSFRLLFTAWLSHFRTLGYIKETTMDHLDKTVLRKILTLSVRDARAREALGSSTNVWTDMLELLRVAVPSLEHRSYATIPTEYNTAADGTTTATGIAYDAPAADVIVSHYATLLRDLQRLNNILCIARNILTAGAAVQNLAAKLSVDREVCCLVNLCVKTTARGYDGHGQPGDEERWQAVVNEFKKLLITCLQFLSNLVTLNERLKLMLWVELFDGSSEGNVPGWHDPAGAVRPGYGGKTAAQEDGDDAWVASATGKLLNGKDGALETGSRKASDTVDAVDDTQALQRTSSTQHEQVIEEVERLSGTLQAQTLSPSRSRSKTTVRRKSSGTQRKRSPRPPTVYLLWLYEQKDGIRADLRQELGVEPTMREVLARATSSWEQMAEQDKIQFQQSRSKELDQWHRELRTWKRDVKSWMATHGIDFDVDDSLHQAATQDRLGDILSEMAEAADAADGRGEMPYLESATRPPARGVARLFESETSPGHPSKGTMETAEDGIRKLEEGKRGLLKRLEDNAAMLSGSSQALPHRPSTDVNGVASPSSPIEAPMSPLDGPLPESPLQEEEEADEELEPEDDDELESDEADDDSSQDDYDRIPGEEGRGLLTDAPLILGPNEIEVLPMIIMSGIVTDQNQVKQKQADATNDQLQVFLNMYTIRCHLLLAQENGRNLLRELLIFVAAWDLREEELYFKFMVKIMESILLHGLMPFAYSAFKESKDIISPAQAVIMKLLTKIFHSRGAFVQPPDSASKQDAPLNLANCGGEGTTTQPGDLPSPKEDDAADAHPNQEHDEQPATSVPDPEALPLPSSPYAPFSSTSGDPTRTIVSTLFSEFRSNIIPQICALIFLQGQIRAGHASIEDFPLNLWDMERMYEGVYQYLEFFAILTDHDDWKELMAEWEVVSELVTLLRELEAGIGKDSRVRHASNGRLVQTLDPIEFKNEEDKIEHEAMVEHLKRESSRAERELAQMRESNASASASAAPQTANASTQSIPSSTGATKQSSGDRAKSPVAVERPYSPLPLAPNNIPGHVSPSSIASSTTPSPSTYNLPPANPTASPAPNALHEEPADFEWRNLKKLAVLVLSSLVWRNRTLQDQVLSYGGVDVLLRCCVPDDHNPYIREHAIMCLRFLVEGNDACRARVLFLDAVSRKRAEWDERAERRAILRAARRREAAAAEGRENTDEGYSDSSDSADEAAAAAEAGDSDLEEPDGSDPVRTAAAYDEGVVVPMEVLDEHGYETFMDAGGQVGLRRKGVLRRKYGAGRRAGDRASVLDPEAAPDGIPNSAAEMWTAPDEDVDAQIEETEDSADPDIDAGDTEDDDYAYIDASESQTTAGISEQPTRTQPSTTTPTTTTTTQTTNPRITEISDTESDSSLDIPAALRPGRPPASVSGTTSKFSSSVANSSSSYTSRRKIEMDARYQAIYDEMKEKARAEGRIPAAEPVESNVSVPEDWRGDDARPRTAADLPDWVARITRDLPHKRAEAAERERESQRERGRVVEGPG